MLWVALHLPLLSLESFAATLAHDAAEAPLALMDVHQNAPRIVNANGAALALGVLPGLKRATALALAPGLTLGRADPARDTQALMAVAHAALAYTPAVCLQRGPDAQAGADTVLLEVQASLRCFGGPQRQLAPLLRQLQADVAPLGHRLHVASAPTALGAAVLARLHRERHCTGADELRQALDAAPVDLLGPGHEHHEALQGMGLRTLGDLRRLPRAGLARRFGAALLGELDRALGAVPDPRVPLVLPPAFDSRLELFARADTTEQVLYGAGVLLARLVAWLSARHAFVRRYTLWMHHEPRWRASAQTPEATPLDVALAEPSRDAAHLHLLLRERLAALQLAAPTLELRLVAHDTVQRAAPNAELFPTPANEREGLVRLIERLQARLGPAQVQRLVAVQDHRPERAAEVCSAGARPAAGPLHEASSAARATAAALPRPVWLLAPPQPLAERQSRPVLDGQPLQLLSGPERIEAGWWDAALAERDYFIAQAASGALVWVYRARLPLTAPDDAQGWFLHGRFG